MQRVSISFVLVLLSWGLIVSTIDIRWNTTGTIDDPNWSESESIPTYVGARLKGYIIANYSFSLNITLLNDGSPRELLFEINQKASPSNPKSKARADIDIEVPRGGVVLMEVKSLANPDLIIGNYIIYFSLSIGMTKSFSTFLPFLLSGILVVALSSIYQREPNLEQYISWSPDADILEIGVIVLLSLLIFTPKGIQALSEPLQLDLLASKIHAVIWWLVIIVFSWIYFTTNVRKVQYLWTYPEGKELTFKWRLIEAIKRIWTALIHVYITYYAIVYYYLAGNDLYFSRISDILLALSMNGLIVSLYLMVIGSLMMFSNTVITQLLSISSAYLTFEELNLIPFRISNLLNLYLDPVIFILLLGIDIVLVFVLRRLYVHLEVN